MSIFGGPPKVHKLESRRDVPGLIKALTYEKDPWVRLLAARALGNVGDHRAIEPLMAALTDRGFNLITSEDDYLLSGDDKIKRKDRYNVVCWEAAAALNNIDSNWSKSNAARAAVPMFIAVLKNRVRVSTKDRDYGVRRVAVQALGLIGDGRGVESLIAALRDEEEDIRYDAVEALSEIGDVRAVEPLIASLLYGDYVVCKAAFRSLDKIEPNWRKSEAASAAVPAFIAGLKDSDNCVRWAAGEALDKIGVARPAEARANL